MNWERIGVTMVPLEKIRPNPYQPRMAEDPAHVEEVAVSIARDGLLQPPVGRPTRDGFVELAFGHTRWAAFRLLAEQDAKRWGRMPVRVVMGMDDESMFRLAVVENVRRRDLNPLEEARALKRYMDEFGKTAREAGELFGLAESTVRGKVRLLHLQEVAPEAAEALADGRLGEGAARVLLQVARWPREKARSLWKALVNNAVQGEQEAALLGRVRYWVSINGKRLPKKDSKGWANWVWSVHDALEPVPDGVRASRCVDCQMAVTFQGVWYCLDDRCAIRKDAAFREQFLRPVAEALGVGIVLEPHRRTVLGEWPQQWARAKGCENLAVEVCTGCEVEGYTHARLVCRRKSCTCVQETLDEAVAELIQQDAQYGEATGEEEGEARTMLTEEGEVWAARLRAHDPLAWGIALAHVAPSWWDSPRRNRLLAARTLEEVVDALVGGIADWYGDDGWSQMEAVYRRERERGQGGAA